MEWISFESFALAVLIVALAAFLVWRQMREAAEPLEDRRDQREEGKNIIRFSDPSTIVIKDYQDALAKYNDTEHQVASMEPFCGAGKLGGINPAIAAALVGARVQQTANAYQSDDYKRRLNAGIQNQRKAEQPIEPPKTAQEAAFHDLMMYGTGVMHTSPSGETRHVPQDEWIGAGGSFDGGGASGDWGSSSSSSSSSSDCSSSSYDSGGSCGGSSD